MDTHEEKALAAFGELAAGAPIGTVSESMMGSVDLVNSVSNEQRACAYRGSVEILAVCVRAQILLVSSAAFILGRFHVKQDGHGLLE